MADKRLLLKLEKIDKSFPGVHALDHVDFDLYEGEVHVLVGENGAGKSTLVKIISGSLEPDSGKIFIRQEELDRLDPERSQERGIGMVYQELSLIPALTVAENIFLGQWPRNKLGIVDWPEINRKAKESLTAPALIPPIIPPTDRSKKLLARPSDHVIVPARFGINNTLIRTQHGTHC